GWRTSACRPAGVSDLRLLGVASGGGRGGPVDPGRRAVRTDDPRNTRRATDLYPGRQRAGGCEAWDVGDTRARAGGWTTSARPRLPGGAGPGARQRTWRGAEQTHDGRGAVWAAPEYHRRHAQRPRALDAEW